MPFPARNERPRSRRRRGLGPTIVVLLAIVGAAVGSLSLPQAAAAAELGPGFQQPGKPLNHLGGYLTPEGTLAYCIEVGLPSPLGHVTTESGSVGSVNGLDPTAMLRLDHVLSTHGSTTDGVTAAAVAMTVWSIADEARYVAAGGDDHALRRAPEQHRAAILSLAEKFRAESAAYERPTPEADLRLTIDDHDERRGYLEVRLRPESATATVTLESAEFVSVGDAVDPSAVNQTAATSTAVGATIRQVVDGDRLPLRATPGDTEIFRVGASSDDVTVSGVPGGTVRVFTTPDAQTLVAAGAPVDLVASASTDDVRDRRSPVLTTRAQATATVGDEVSDMATATGLPAAGVLVRFQGYLQPAPAVIPTCTEETLIYRASAPRHLAADGEVRSESFPVRADHVGVVFWVATLETAAGQVLTAGTCGDPNEVTTIGAPPRLPVVSG